MPPILLFLDTFIVAEGSACVKERAGGTFACWCAKTRPTTYREEGFVMLSFAGIAGVIWNLFLAVIPVGLAYSAAGLFRRVGAQPALWLALAPVLLLWFIFLPNSCYLFTEPRHLFLALERGELWSRAPREPHAAVRLVFWISLSLVYTSAGALTFVLSIRPIKALLRERRRPTLAWVVPFFVLMSLGVYLGLVVRYNSWDLFTRPAVVFGTIAETVGRPILLTAIVLFGFVLWAAYEVVDIWVDGFAGRWRRWTGRDGDRVRAQDDAEGRRAGETTSVGA